MEKWIVGGLVGLALIYAAARLVRALRGPAACADRPCPSCPVQRFCEPQEEKSETRDEEREGEDQ